MAKDDTGETCGSPADAKAESLALALAAARRNRTQSLPHHRTLNYIHANPVKHGFVEKGGDWPWSSYAQFEGKYGREALVEWWREFPITGYGKGWDD